MKRLVAKGYFHSFANISRIKDNIKTIKSLPKIKGVKEIMYPGQNKDKRFRMNLKKEIKLSKIIQKDLVDLNN